MKFICPAPVSTFASLVIITGAIPALAQGPLTPPGPPAPTMKTLNQVEPRTPIAQSDIPLTIANAGSYVLTENLIETVGSAIQVDADDVTINLNGFVIDGQDTGLVGVEVLGARQGISIRDGTIRGFAAGVDAFDAQNVRCIRLNLFGRIAGIGAGAHALVLECMIRSSPGNGVIVGSNSVVKDCLVTAGFAGIAVSGGRARIEGCTVAFALSGIDAGIDSDIQGNLCVSNTVNGISADKGNRIVDNRILDGGGSGLRLISTNNYVAGNVVRGNADNYDFAAGNQLNLLLCEIPETLEWPAKVTLAGTLTGSSGSSGILITANDVTIDLDGHALIGTPGSLEGITWTSSHTNVTVRNGTIRNWGRSGVRGLGPQSRLERLLVYRNALESPTNPGMRAGVNSLVTECVAEGNPSTGIETGTGCVVSECLARSNGGPGFEATRSNLKACVASNNLGHGFDVENSSTVTSCVATDNGGSGISASFGCTVRESSVRFCNGSGISVSARCLVSDNACDLNGLAVTGGAGIHVNGDGSRIERNLVTNNGLGINVTAAGNFIVANSASGNATNYVVSGVQTIGPIITSTGTITSENPWANFSF